LTLIAVFVLGIVASGHCLVMCGGISSALGLATSKAADGRPRWDLLLSYQLGRVSSYALAGLLLAGAFGGVIALLDLDWVRRALRIVSALTLVLAALVVLGILRDPGSRIGRLVWPRLASLGRRLLPVTSVPRAFGFGMIWGWMPCSFVYTLLVIATFQQGAVRGAAIMAAFGAGTLPALLGASLGSARLAAIARGNSRKRLAGLLLLMSAAVTLAGPWVAHAAPSLQGWLPFECGPGKSSENRP
jgi:sulfite exporter TauE/SafE